MSFQVAGNFGTETLHKEEALRPWADKTHVAPNDVDQLRQFVQAQPPHEPSDRGSSDIIRRREDRASLRFGIGDHRPKLVERKEAASLTNPVLPVQDRPV